MKSLMAKFNTLGNPTQEVNSRPFKVAGQNSPSGVQARKNLFDNQGNASPPAGPGNVPKFGSPKPPLAVKPSEDKPDVEPKPPFLKPTGAGPRFVSPSPAASASRGPEGKAEFPRPVGLKPTNLPREDAKPAFPRPPGNKPALPGASQDHDLKPPGLKPKFNPPAQENEQKQVFPKLSGIQGKFVSASQDHDPKPLFPKPPFGQKPSLSVDDPHEAESPAKNAALQRGTLAPLGVKAKVGPLKPAKEDPEDKDHGGETSSSPFPGVVLKPAASRGGPGLPKSTEERREDRRIDAAKNVFLSKMNQEEPASGAPPAKFPKTPSKVAVAGPWGQSQEKEKGDKNPATPKQKPLPPLSVLGPPPPKPSRPPQVNLTKFYKAASGNSEFSQCLFNNAFCSAAGGVLAPGGRPVIRNESSGARCGFFGTIPAWCARAKRWVWFEGWGKHIHQTRYVVWLQHNHFIYFLSLVSFLLSEMAVGRSYYHQELHRNVSETLRQGFSGGVLLTARRHLAMSGGTFHRHSRRVPLASGEQRAGMLPPTLQCTGQPLPPKEHPAPKSTVQRFRTPPPSGCECSQPHRMFPKPDIQMREQQVGFL